MASTGTINTSEIHSSEMIKLGSCSELTVLDEKMGDCPSDSIVDHRVVNWHKLSWKMDFSQFESSLAGMTVPMLRDKLHVGNLWVSWHPLVPHFPQERLLQSEGRLHHTDKPRGHVHQCPKITRLYIIFCFQMGLLISYLCQKFPEGRVNWD